jgi:hypothetical protein
VLEGKGSLPWPIRAHNTTTALEASPAPIGVVPWVLNLVRVHGRSLEYLGVSARTQSVTVTIDELHKNGEVHDVSAGPSVGWLFFKFPQRH